ncbi:MAG: polysaccharide export protein [Paludibacteraceae bacterium]|nr:polysaccharide export protein [Paludibacteraceae bacterium]MBQ4018468.1 polysaccharide export protein [Paludibacteraceae bacterium]
MNKTLKLIALGIVAVLAAGCVTQKKMTYLQTADASIADSINAHYTPQTELIIRNGDAMTIFVSALDKEAVAPYNLPTVVYNTPGSNSVQTTPMLQYYTVDEEGNIEMPVLGKIHVAGLKRTEVETHIKSLLESQVLNPMVQVQLVNARVSVLGEVNAPGQIPFTKNRMTILDALAAAGDLTVYGQRHDVLVTREVNGKLEMGRVDLRSVELYTSPYYFLQQNDIVYVTPNKVRAVSSTNSGLWLSIVSTALSAATVIVTVVK